MWQQAKLEHDGQHYVLKVPGTGRTWWLIIIGTGLAILLAILLMGEKSLLKAGALQNERKDLLAQMDAVRIENRKLTQQIVALQKDPKAVERIAREELGMVRPEELVYRFVPPASRKKEK
jgi:cell division protein FtsB